MADPKKEEKKPEVSAVEVLAAKEKELLELQAKNKLKLVEEEIAKLKNGGLSPSQVKRRDAALAKQAKTAKETVKTPEGKEVVLAIYVTNQPSYKALVPGGTVGHRPEGTILRIPAEQLPGESLDPVETVPAAKQVDFKKA